MEIKTMTTFFVTKNKEKESENMLQNNEKSAEVLKTEKIVKLATMIMAC